MGWTNADNKFGPSPFIVGTILGDGCNYISIQAAYVDADLAGGGTIIIRQGSYTENLSLNSVNRISFFGAAAPGFAGVAGTGVTIAGQATYTATGYHSFENIDFTFASTPISLANSTPASISFTNCSIIGIGAANGVEYVGSDTMTQRYSGCTIIGANALLFGGVIGSNVQLTANDCQFLANTSSAYADFCFVSGSASFADCKFQGVTFGLNLQGNTQGVTTGSQIISGLECFNIVGGSARCFNTTLFCTGSGTGFNVTGNGQFIYGGVISEGVDIGIDPTISQTVLDWKAYAQIATAPATPATPSLRGTCCFDDTQFAVTSGFVQLSTTGVASTFTTDAGTAAPVANNINILGGPGVTTSAAGDTITVNSVVWTDRIASVLVTSDSGTFDASAGTATFTLPAAPSQGEECRFVCINSGGVIQANAGQVISIGNQNSTAAGTATSTAGGDSLWLTYNAGTLRWFSVATNGNWMLA